MLQSLGSQRDGHDLANWTRTELKIQCILSWDGEAKEATETEKRTSNLNSGVREVFQEESCLCWDVSSDNEGRKWKTEASSWQNELGDNTCKDPELRGAWSLVRGTWEQQDRSKNGPSLVQPIYACYHKRDQQVKERASGLPPCDTPFSLQLQAWRFGFTKATGPGRSLKPWPSQIRALPAFITQGRKSSPEQRPSLRLSFALLTPTRVITSKSAAILDRTGFWGGGVVWAGEEDPDADQFRGGAMCSVEFDSLGLHGL